MAARTYAVAGPWDTEPDEWAGEFHGLKVRARRHNFTGAWLGYVLLPRGHRCWGTDPNADVHGGVTYAGFGAYQDNLDLMARAVADDAVWEVGFDCGHAFDYQPGMRELEGDKTSYRDLEYVKAQLEALAAQLA